MRSSQTSDVPNVLSTTSLFFVFVLETVLRDLKDFLVVVVVFLVVVVGGGEGVVVVVVVVVVVMVVVDRVAGEVFGTRVVDSVAGLCFLVFCCNLFHQGMVVLVLMARAGDRVVVVEGVVIWFHQVLLVLEVS